MNRQPTERAPALEPALGYPTLSDHGAARRRFLKLCALSTAAAALGLELVGCPDSSGGGGGATVTPPKLPLPWTVDEPRLGGKMAIPMGAPVAMVVGGGVIAVTFQDGVSMDVVVAVVVTPQDGIDVKKDLTSQAKQHAQVVQDTAKGLSSAAVTDAAGVEAFEDALRGAINATLSGAYVNEVSIAQAEQPSEPQKAAPARKAAATERPGEAKRMKAAPEPAPKLSTRALKAKRLWSPCREPGCTSCGS